MTTNFPTSVDAFTNPTSGDTLDNPPHDQQHANINDAMEAVQTALLDGSPLKIDDANNRVGIGTTSPSSPLHIKADSFDMLSLDRTDNANVDQQVILTPTYSGAGNTAFAIKIGSEIMRVTEAGNVGINDTTPSYTLDVNGDINATGDVRIAGKKHGGQLLAATRTGGDISLSTTATTALTISFTLTENTYLGFGYVLGELDSWSTNPQLVYARITESTTQAQQFLWGYYDRQQGWNTIASPNGFSGYIPFGAGSHSLDLVLSTNTGTVRVDNASSISRYTILYAISFGGY